MSSARIKKCSNTLNQNISIARILFFLFVNTITYSYGHSSKVSLGKVSLSQKAHLQSLPKVAPLLGESAIIDKETGRVYWQGGEQSLFHATVGHTYLKNKAGLARHVRATLYSCILWMSVIKFLAKRILADTDLYLNHFNMIILSDRIRRCIKYATNVLRFLLVCLTCLPKFHRSFLVVIGIFYFIESYTCSTRKYLSNVLLPENVERYMDLIKEQKPCVKWDLRCFHYEKRKFLCMILLVDLWKLVFSFMRKNEDEDEQESKESGCYASPSMLSKKVITYQATKYYKFNSWEDETVSGISKQSEAGTTINSDFTKISVCKLVLFANAKSRADYFIQQSNFVNQEGTKDTYAELSTKVEVQGFKKRLLLVKRSNGLLRNFFTLHCFWICTCLLLTVPFRVKFSRYCDELHLTLAKETSIDMKKNADDAAYNSWLLSTKSWFSGTRIGSFLNKSPEGKEKKLGNNDTSLKNNQHFEKTNSLDEVAESESLQPSRNSLRTLIPQIDDKTTIEVEEESATNSAVPKTSNETIQVEGLATLSTYEALATAEILDANIDTDATAAESNHIGKTENP